MICTSNGQESHQFVRKHRCSFNSITIIPILASIVEIVLVQLHHVCVKLIQHSKNVHTVQWESPQGIIVAKNIVYFVVIVGICIAVVAILTTTTPKTIPLITIGLSAIPCTQL